MPVSTESQGTNKRRASTQLFKENIKSTKYQRPPDFLNMTVKEAYDDMVLFPSRIIDADGLASNDTSSDVSIELVLRRLFALHKLLGLTNSSSPIVPVQKGDVYEDEFKVERILNMEMGKSEPLYEVKWFGFGFDELTWEPVANIYDCKAFEVFSGDFVRQHETELTRIWQAELQPQESLEADAMSTLSDTEALAIVEQFDYYTFQTFLFQLCLYHEKNVNRTTKLYQSIYERFRTISKHFKYYSARLRQLQAMHKWHETINSIDKSKNLRIENRVDFEEPPHEEFTYTNDRIARDGIIIPDDPPVGCDCSTTDGQCSGKSQCCPSTFDAKFAYTSKGLLRAPQGTPIFECNKRCTCSDNCPNRVVQKGRKQSLCIFKTPNGRGWGLRTDRAIAKGAYVCEYVGEIISAEETERRGKEYDARGRTYLFDLDFNEKDNPFTVDAAKYGNISRFMNHSCNPNVGVWAVWTDCLDLDLPKLCFFALRSIKQNEELTFDYMNRNQNDDSVEHIIQLTAEQSLNETGDSPELIAGSQKGISHLESTFVKYADRTTDEGNESLAYTNETDKSRETNESSLCTSIDRTADEGNESIGQAGNESIDTNDSQKGDNAKNESGSRSDTDNINDSTSTKYDSNGFEPKKLNTSQQSADSVIKAQAFECKCGAYNCRKVLFF